jgi:hypothetical protein
MDIRKNIKYIIIILILISIIFLIKYYNKTNYSERFIINVNNNPQFVQSITNFMNNGISNYANMTITNSLYINNINLKDYLNNIKYPVGCYYVQYPDSKTNFENIGGSITTAFPDDKAPEFLFGGKWEPQFSGESIFFRTPNIRPGSDNVGSDKRKSGVQDYALIKFTGATAWAQAGDMMGGTKDPFGFGSSGAFSFIKDDPKYIKGIATDKGWGSGLGLSYVLDIKNALPFNTSETELRVTNRTIVVWKRIK